MKHPLYWADFLLAPLATLAVITLTCRSWEWVGLFVLGFILWTLAEYWVHRLLLHGILWLGKHEQHHNHPEDYQVLWQFPVLFMLGALIIPWPIYAGLGAGYTWFAMVHHTLHHFNLRYAPAYIRRYAKWHNVHHFINIHANYGITTNIWDRVFRTYQRTPTYT